MNLTPSDLLNYSKSGKPGYVETFVQLSFTYGTFFKLAYFTYLQKVEINL